MRLQYSPPNSWAHGLSLLYMMSWCDDFFSWMWTISHRDIFSSCCKIKSVLFNSYAPINVTPAGRGGGAGRAWGGDLIVFVGNGVGHLTDLVLPGEGIFESFFARCGDIWLPTRTKKTETEHNLPLFHASHMRHTVWKDLEIMEANENKRKPSGFNCFVFKFCLF